MNKSLLPDDINLYMHRTFVKEAAVLNALREETAKMEEAGMQISADQGHFLSFLINLIGAERTLEVGVFTGYSSLATALALPEHGRIVACDVSEVYTAIARRNWQAAGVSRKIDLRLGPAVGTLDALLAEGAVFDFCFIDADKPNYCNYYERAVQLVRQNGLIAVDNTLWHGQIVDTEDTSEGTVAIRQLNAMVGSDPRVEATLVPLGDGMTLARKR